MPFLQNYDFRKFTVNFTDREIRHPVSLYSIIFIIFIQSKIKSIIGLITKDKRRIPTCFMLIIRIW